MTGLNTLILKLRQMLPAWLVRALPASTTQIGPTEWQRLVPWPQPRVDAAIRKVSLAGKVDMMLCPMSEWVSDNATRVSIQAKTKQQAEMFFTALWANLR